MVNLTLVRLLILCPLLTMLLIYQSISSIRWMYANAYNLSPVQEARLNAGKWLQEHGDKTQWVMSGDLGAIGYAAKDFKIIDTFGLCSKDVLEAYKNRDNIDAILYAKKQMYLVDTFNIANGELRYTHLDGKFLKFGKPSTFLNGKILDFEKLYSWDNKPYAIGIARIE